MARRRTAGIPLVSCFTPLTPTPGTTLCVLLTVTTCQNGSVVQRVYGVAFPSAQQLKDWKALREERARRDHRVVGKQQALFYFHAASPGSAFFLPHGTRLYRRLEDFVRQVCLSERPYRVERLLTTGALTV